MYFFQTLSLYQIVCNPVLTTQVCSVQDIEDQCIREMTYLLTGAFVTDIEIKEDHKSKQVG